MVFCRIETDSKSVIIERECKKRVLPISVARKCPLDLVVVAVVVVVVVDDDDIDDNDIHS